MASVYYLFDDALHIADDIVESYSHQDKVLKENHFAATVIQRSYRGYVVRKSYRKCINAATVLEKYVRGWLVRYHLPDTLQEYWDRKCLERYNNAATRLQAAWKGVLVRNEIDIKYIMEEKYKLSHISATLNRASLEVASQTVKEASFEIPPQDQALSYAFPLGQDKMFKTRILEILFDRHHLLSTSLHKGVLESNSELKALEKVLQALPWKDYMQGLRQIYYKYRKVVPQEQKTTYMFADKKMRKQEDLCRLRDKTHDVKDIPIENWIADNRKPFNLYSKMKEQPYKGSLLNKGKYSKRETNISRTQDESKNIGSKDFIITLKQIVKECKIPPYYLDFWYRDCFGHSSPQ